MQTEFQDLINYRIQQANETIKEVEFQIENNFLVIAVNRIYYGMFYMLLALALKNGFKTSKHNQLLGWFNREFVKTGRIDRKIGKIVHKAFEDRTDGDYGIFVKFEKEEVIEKLENMKRFLFELEKLIKEN
ncbi:HEPN domain-containing protein [Mariniphaga sediminis]|uniref:HEPN domain-containing protein n=2 Tax=Mariniphaga sediminis TaxID=1628158 RepID=A0A399D465_9BACT|nr:HEPN domain-containing protein [Mariniphaga sediminis]RIH65988.1 HEPN domain-containing protein [Mariniphaga sediminis]